MCRRGLRNSLRSPIQNITVVDSDILLSVPFPGGGGGGKGGRGGGGNGVGWGAGGCTFPGPGPHTEGQRASTSDFARVSSDFERSRAISSEFEWVRVLSSRFENGLSGSRFPL